MNAFFHFLKFLQQKDLGRSVRRIWENSQYISGGPPSQGAKSTHNE